MDEAVIWQTAVVPTNRHGVINSMVPVVPMKI